MQYVVLHKTKGNIANENIEKKCFSPPKKAKEEVLFLTKENGLLPETL